jgi:hypothetical protein
MNTEMTDSADRTWRVGQVLDGDLTDPRDLIRRQLDQV